MRYITFGIFGGEKDANGITRKAIIRQIKSTCNGAQANELPFIMHALKNTVNLIQETEDVCFDYTFDFEL